MAKPIPLKLKLLVLERDGHVCVLQLPGCRWEATVADHRAGRGMGGSETLNAPECLVAACGLCNGNREDSTGAERQSLIDRGIYIRKDSTNAKTRARCANTPVKYPDGEWYLLRPNGKREHIVAPDF